MLPPRETDCGIVGSAEPVNTRRRPMSTSLPGTDRRRTPRGRRGRHVKTEWPAKARIHSRVASALPHSEGTAYKPLCGEIAVCPREGRMGSIKFSFAVRTRIHETDVPYGRGRPPHDVTSFWIVMMGQDNITWTGARAPGVERRRSLAWRCSTELVASDTERRIMLLRRARRMEANLISRRGCWEQA